MNININVKREFTINGKKYSSIEEMPDDVRELFKKMMALRADAEHQANPGSLQQTRITFNTALGAADTDAASPTIDLTTPSSDKRREPGTPGTVHSNHHSQPTKFESSFSARVIIVSVILSALLYLLYYLWQSRVWNISR